MVSRFGMLLASAAVCLAQQPTFDAASVKPFDSSTRPPWLNTGGPGTSDPGRVHLAHASMIDLLAAAYGVEMDQIAGGPAWARDIRGPNFYVLDATMPPDTTKAQYRAMLQNLLAGRFQLVVHHETRNFPGYELRIAKDGPNLKESPPRTDSGISASDPPFSMGKVGFPNLPPGSRCTVTTSAGTWREKCQERSLSQLAGDLGRQIRVALGGEVLDFTDPDPRVVDKTGLDGRYDFTLEYACAGCKGLGDLAPILAARRGDAPPPAAAAPEGGGLPTIFAALEKQLGLTLEKVKNVAVDVVVIDRIEKTPVGN